MCAYAYKKVRERKREIEMERSDLKYEIGKQFDTKTKTVHNIILFVYEFDKVELIDNILVC